MARSRDAMVQRGHHFAIIDEVDSILIDEARTPLIISGPAAESAQLYYQFAGIVRTLRAEDVDYEVDEEKRTVVPTEAGIEKVERQLGVDNLYDAVAVNYVHHLTQALLAKELYRRDKDYLVAQGEVRIVDEFTGRTLDGRRWSDGLHQAVEAKERVKIKEENHTWATVTLQNYFRLYEKLGRHDRHRRDRGLRVRQHLRAPGRPDPAEPAPGPDDQPDLIYKSEEAKFAAVVEDIAERHATGQPVLVGTASVSKSEHLSRLLDKRGIPHEVLNAKQHFREAEIVAQAGRVGAVTVATNMAGRGVDIILGGNPEGLAAREAAARGIDLDTEEGAAELAGSSRSSRRVHGRGRAGARLGGLYVLGSERHESRRIDNQLRGRSGRQGDPGESRFFLSLEDDLMRLFATGAMNWVMGRALPDDVPDRGEDGDQGHRAGPEHRRGPQRRVPQGRPQVRRRDERAAQGHLRPAHADHRGRGPPRGRHHRAARATMTELVATDCPTDYPEEWDLPGLSPRCTQYYPTKFVADDFAEATTAGQVTESVITEALELYAERDETIPGGEETARQLERDIMLQIIDQRWQDHLADMDYLQEGINLRAMGNQDPLVAWQREGFAMFGKLMDGIDDDYLRYVFHVQVLTEERPPSPIWPRPATSPPTTRSRATPRSPAAFATATPAEIEAGRRPSPAGRSSAPAGQRRRRRGAAGPHREVGPGEDRAQRAVLVRQRQEVQALPRRQLRWPPTAPGRGRAGRPGRHRRAPCAVAERLREAERFLGARRLVERRAELETGGLGARPVGRRRPRP